MTFGKLENHFEWDVRLGGYVDTLQKIGVGILYKPPGNSVLAEFSSKNNNSCLNSLLRLAHRTRQDKTKYTLESNNSLNSKPYACAERDREQKR